MNFSLEELNTLYAESESVDSDSFAEMRSNLMLVAGHHYAKNRSQNNRNRVTDNPRGGAEQRIRLVNNHIDKICNLIQQNIHTLSPGVKAFPANEKELKDQKSAELHNALLSHIKSTVDFESEQIRDLEDFVDLGEVATKIFWDEEAGKMVEKQFVDENGQIVTQKAPTGSLVFERIYGFNLLRPKGCKELKKAPWLIVRKMVSIKELKARLKDPKKIAKLEEGKDETYQVFDAKIADYVEVKGEVMLKECYWKPCVTMPNGYYSIFTQNDILWEGELPFGLFPIEYENYMELPTLPRGISPIRVMRPFQAEINRCASKIAEHQITLGDDKLITFGNTKVSKGADLPGVRHLQVQGGGQEPTIIGGRSGEQYLAYHEAKKAELYEVMNVSDDAEDKGQVEPMSLLLQSAKKKKRFAKYATKFERFQVRKYKLALDLFRNSAPDDYTIEVIGAKEAVNMAEIRGYTDSTFSIKVEPVSGDIDEVYGKQMVLNHVLQYVGQNMNNEDAGKIIRAMPLVNKEELLSDLTLGYDTATNVILALDRGEKPPIGEYENHQYMINKLTNRMSQSDFMLIPTEVQQAYKMRVVQHEMMMAEQEKRKMEAQQGFVPATGPLIAVDFYVSDPDNPTRTRRARLPSDSVRWLVDRLEKQGTMTAALNGLPPEASADVGQMIGGQASPQGVPNESGASTGAAAATDSGGGQFTGAITGANPSGAVF